MFYEFIVFWQAFNKHFATSISIIVIILLFVKVISHHFFPIFVQGVERIGDSSMYNTTQVLTFKKVPDLQKYLFKVVNGTRVVL